MHAWNTHRMIEAFVAAQGEGQCPRQQHVLRQALHGLVRQARSEYRLEMRCSVRTLMGNGLPRQCRLPFEQQPEGES